MYAGSPFFARYRSYSRFVPAGLGWLAMVPGLVLIVGALAILIWPQLLAYLVATVLLFVGIMLTLWGWSLRRFERQRRQQGEDGNTVYYRVV